MKEFNKSNKVTYNLMTFTGFKSLLLFELLLESPKSYEEINEFFKNHEYIKETISIDTLRVYITSLKRVGCDIERIKTEEGPKYKLFSHPFEFKINEAQIKSVGKIYRILLNTATTADLFDFEEFILRLAANIDSKELAEVIEKQSIFKNFDKNLLRDLFTHAKHNHKITIEYDSPKSGLKNISLVVDGINYTQCKLYLYGVNCSFNQESSYLISRISKIVDVDESHQKINLDYVTVGYELSTNNSNIRLEDNEKIVEIKDDSIIVEANTTNLFMMKRKILEYGAACTVLYPDAFRNDIIKTLLNMREEYRDG